jgi:hypothetical protein
MVWVFVLVMENSKWNQYIKHTSSCDAQEIITKDKRLKLAFGIFKFKDTLN